MLGWSIRRVGLIDITVGNATRLGASQRSATRRSASHHIATQRLSRWGSPAARARSARTVPLKRLWLRDGHVKRNICERMNSPLRDVPCSNADIDLRLERDLAGRHHRIPTNQSADFSDGHLRLAQFDLSQKSHKVAILLGIYWFPRFRSRTDGKEAAVARGAEGRWSSPRVVQSSPEARRCGRTHNSRL
jgi:hypothetical protein